MASFLNRASLYEIAHPIFNPAGNDSVDTIIAIALAESNGNPLARNRNQDGSIDRGVLQINNRAHPEVTDACAYFPPCAFQKAWAISNHGTNFTPWTTFTSGAYKQYKLNKAGTGGQTNTGFLGAPFGPPGAPGAPDLSNLNPISGLNAFFKALGVIFQGGFWLRVLMVLGGLGLVLFGLAMAGKQYAVTSTIKSAVKGATE